MYILIGAGGHSKVVLDILMKENKKVLGFIDDNRTGIFEGFPILGQLKDVQEIMEKKQNAKIIVCIGDNLIREKIVKSLEGYNVKFGQAVHPSAQIATKALIGNGTVIMANAVINHSANIGSHVIINTGATVDHDCLIEDYVHISPGVHLAGNVLVKKNTHVGIGSNVIQNITIGAYSQVGAGAAVIDNIMDYSLAVGVPAKVIKKRGNDSNGR